MKVCLDEVARVTHYYFEVSWVVYMLIWWNGTTIQKQEMCLINNTKVDGQDHTSLIKVSCQGYILVFEVISWVSICLSSQAHSRSCTPYYYYYFLI